MDADSDAVLHALTAWMPMQRWFAGKGAGTSLTARGSVELTPHISIRLVADANPSAGALYQVPLVESGEGGIGAGVHDGPHDRSFAAALVDAIFTATSIDGEVAVTGVPLSWQGPPPVVRSAKVLTGEQSNTSIILELEDGETGAALRPAIVKVFRALHHGENPDVVLQSAISGAGSARVPVTFGALVGSWPDASVPGGVATGHLAVAQEFLPGTEDAWRVALTAARAGDDFQGQARALGEATAEVHRILAATMGTAEADDRRRAGVLASMRERAARAARLVPSVAAVSGRIDELMASAVNGDWPALQRVHGDYHLGQVLSAPGRGWVLLDFEGEPLRPMSERSELDVPLRDVAGMLRSFDYVAGTISLEGGDATAWAAATRAAFLAGYGAELGASLDRYLPLISALELDKALYECEYEARNRPTWLPIPEAAVLRLIDVA